MNRPVMVRDSYNINLEKEAVFLQFGVDYEELGDNVGQYSTAIVEYPDGKIGSHYVGLVRFADAKAPKGSVCIK